jgi:hypothetical protein
MNKISIRKNFLTFIKHKDFPACINCVYFIEDKSNYPYDPPPSDEKYGKCRLFGSQNMVTGNINHEYAVLCRENEKKCNKNGKFFTKK